MAVVLSPLCELCNIGYTLPGAMRLWRNAAAASSNSAKTITGQLPQRR
jgi:hypothetical protein